MNSNQLDEYCFNILMVLYYEGKPLGFNELCQKTEKLFGFSRPTLSFHLKHLTNKGLVLKKVEKHGNLKLPTSKYEITPDVYKFVPDVRPTLEKWERLASKKDFKSLAESLYNDFATLSMLTLQYHIKTMLGEADATKGLWLSQICLTIFTKTLYQKIQLILKNAKKGEITELMKEWNAIIKRNIEYLYK
ncbi:MAG: helix-turn-helix domain-containing protein [Candidatus Bathyarchaeia archaeon]